MQRDTEDSLPPSDGDEIETRLPLVDVETAKARPSARRKRLWQVGIALATVLAVLFAFRGIYSPRQAPAPPAPTERTIPPPLALFDSNVNFGAMIINNKLFPKQPVLLPVPQDDYTVTLTASPFHPVTCHISHLHSSESEAGPDQRCQLTSGTLGLPIMTRNGITGSPTYLVSVLLGLDDLPPEQQAAVHAAISSQVFTLRQQTTVPTGDYYATAADQNGTITSQRATRPLQAEVGLVSALGLKSALPSFCGNSLICVGPVDPLYFSTSSAREWLVQINTAIRWRFTTDTGQVMGEATYLFFGSTIRYFAYDATRGWRIDEMTGQTTEGPNELGIADCQAGAASLQLLTQGINGAGYSYDAYSSIEGCFLTINNNTASQEKLLWRFGVLLAADQAAHTSFPNLPIAPKQEIDIIGG